MFKSYIAPAENQEARRQLPKLMVEGLLLGGTGLGVLALIFEIAADAFSVAAYQTLLAIHGAEGHHKIAILAFILLSALLLLGIVPAYKAGAYLRPNAGGSGPLVEAIGPPKIRWLSWIGTSLFFLDAILTIIISSISASDVTMLILPELAPYRIVLAELFAFFIMVVLVALGPKRAVPIFLIGGGAFTLFTIVALSIVGGTAMGNPEWAFLTKGIVSRLELNGVVEHVVRAQQDIATIGTVVFFQLFFRSMSSAMLGFSGYEVIPASGKHAARPKWKVINTSLSLAAFFLIGTGVVQLYAAQQWNIPATEGYSTLLIEYEIIAAQTFGTGISENDVAITEQDREEAGALYDLRFAENVEGELLGEVPGEADDFASLSRGEFVDEVAYDLAVTRQLENATNGTTGQAFLVVAGTLLAIILLLAQGGGYVGGAAVAANAARLGRLPSMFTDDRIGISVIWGIAAILIPIIREVVIVESYYAFGFVSAFVITSTTVFFVREDAMRERGIEPGSSEAKSLRFAGLRGMIASYIMMIVLIWQKSDALVVIAIFGAIITVIQIINANGGLKKLSNISVRPASPLEPQDIQIQMGLLRAHDEARQRGIMNAVEDLIHEGAFAKFNVGPHRIRELICHLYQIHPGLFEHDDDHHERIEEPSTELEETYTQAYEQRKKILRDVEDYSHFGIFTFIHNYHINWVSEEHGRNAAMVQKAMLNILFPQTEADVIWKEFCAYMPKFQPEPIWQFSRRRYLWAKDQWPNLSDRITTIWTLQDFGLISRDINVETIIAVADGKKQMLVKIPSNPKADNEGETKKEALD
ncbi:MAG: hypothetical protein H6654_12960 [Ardenticatenaceae bacterium]|nr:hypothetical protein [Anaerolineales bacterium]MCB8941643.1 hypothetical protein [Ardenticatenaceae bacterium]MCB8974462.1 hypothetical protein [Ardenticatenaceae bacterium]